MTYHCLQYKEYADTQRRATAQALRKAETEATSHRRSASDRDTTKLQSVYAELKSLSTAGDDSRKKFQVRKERRREVTRDRIFATYSSKQKAASADLITHACSMQAWTGLLTTCSRRRHRCSPRTFIRASL